MNRKDLLGRALALLACNSCAYASQQHNVILFVPDGLRAQIVDARTGPALARLRDRGVNFVNSHALFPTFTTANASALATGHLLGDTGAFSNTILSPFPMKSGRGTVTPYLESDAALREIDGAYNHRFLSEDSLVALAAAAHYSTALIGKVGPVAVFDPACLNELPGRTRTLLIDDATGKNSGAGLSPAWRAAFERAGVPLDAPGRGENGNFGAFDKPGTIQTDAVQQRYFLDVTLKVVLPKFKKARRPFFLVYWSRDPDGSQHNQGDSFQALSPGINGPTSLAAIRSADEALAALESGLNDLGLFDDTDIIVAADHGFSTLSKESHTSPAAKLAYPDVTPGDLPLGFLAIDLATALKERDPSIKLFDPDAGSAPVDLHAGQHPVRGNGLIGTDPAAPQVIVAANGGSDLVYLPASLTPDSAVRLGHTLIDALLTHDYVSGAFVDEARLGKIPGALSLASIGVGGGRAVTPRPAIIVSFRSFTTGCDRPLLCAAEVSDYFLQQGQGMHGSFSRADTWNFMAARGPDFRKHYIDPLPASNADIGITLAHLLHLSLRPKGPLSGRVLTEALRGSHGAALPIRVERIESDPAPNGLKTVLRTQSVAGHTYYDAAGFPGRTVGLDVK